MQTVSGIKLPVLPLLMWEKIMIQIDDLHAKGIVINCWTVDDPQRAEELAAWGVDYITSNILE